MITHRLGVMEMPNWRCLALLSAQYTHIIMITHRLGVMEMPNWRCLALLSAQYTHIIVE
jgi:hypothetical protein